MGVMRNCVVVVVQMAKEEIKPSELNCDENFQNVFASKSYLNEYGKELLLRDV